MGQRHEGHPKCRQHPGSAPLGRLAAILQPKLGGSTELPRCAATMHVGACQWAQCAIRPVAVPARPAEQTAATLQQRDMLVLAVTSEGMLCEWAVSGLQTESKPRCLLQGQHRLPCHVARPRSASSPDTANSMDSSQPAPASLQRQAPGDSLQNWVRQQPRGRRDQEPAWCPCCAACAGLYNTCGARCRIQAP